MTFSSFAEFLGHARLAMEAFHGQMAEEPRLSAADRRSYYVMIAALAVKWLARSRDVEALAQLRDQITNALIGDQQLN